MEVFVISSKIRFEFDQIIFNCPFVAFDKKGLLNIHIAFLKTLDITWFLYQFYTIVNQWTQTHIRPLSLSLPFSLTHTRAEVNIVAISSCRGKRPNF